MKVKKVKMEQEGLNGVENGSEGKQSVWGKISNTGKL